MAVIHFVFLIAILSPILSEHIENYYIEYLANHHSEYNETSRQEKTTAPTNRLWRKSVGDNQYYLYTRNSANTPDMLVKNDYSSIESSFFDPSLPVVIIVHGWGGDVASEQNPVIKDAFLAKTAVNVIVVDWGQLSKENYVTAVRGVPDVGRHLANFLAYLSSSTNVSFSQMHLVGHSLGAHVVGNAGRRLNARVARITGLDPAGPLWTFNSNRLQSNDARYVEVIHTNRGLLGINFNAGVVDFYPNGGSVQPGCMSPSCSHSRSWKLFAASITNNHLQGRKCSSWLQVISSSCYGDLFNLGTDELIRYRFGMYAMKTGSTFPF